MSAASLRPRQARRLLATLAVALIAALAAAAPALAQNCAPGDPAGQTLRVAFQAANGKWVTNDRTFVDMVSGRLRASASTIGQREAFTFHCLGNGQFGLTSIGSQKISVLLGLTDWRYGTLRASTAASFGPAERFTFELIDGDHFGDGPVYLRSVANGQTIDVESYDGYWAGVLQATGASAAGVFHPRIL